MFRSLLLIGATVGGLLIVLVSVVLIGSMRLRSDWAAAAASSSSTTQPLSADATASAASAAPPTDSSTPQPTAALKPTTKPITLDEAADEPASIFLSPQDAHLSGHARIEDQRVDKKPPPPVDPTKKVDPKKAARHTPPPPRDTWIWITGWQKAEDTAQWTLNLPAAGKYEVDLISCAPKNMGGVYVLTINGQEFRGTPTPSKDGRDFKMITIGTVQLPAGATTVTIRPSGKNTQPVMNLKGVKLIPA